MPNVPNTPAILTAIQTMCQGLQVSGSTFFIAANVVVGKFKDITNNVPALEITQADDESQRLATPSGLNTGGKIRDDQKFLIEITLDMTDSIAVEMQLAQIRDSLSNAFHGSATLNTAGVRYSGWDGAGASGYTVRNGILWRAYKRKLEVIYDYSAIMTI
jgi:hypothetical protein